MFFFFCEKYCIKQDERSGNLKFSNNYFVLKQYGMNVEVHILQLFFNYSYFSKFIKLYIKQVAINVLEERNLAWINPQSANAYIIVSIGKMKQKTSIRRNMETVCDKEVRFKRDFLSGLLFNFAIHI